MKILSATGVFFLRIYRIIALLSWSIVITSVAFICTVFRKEAVAVRRAAYFTQVWARVCARIMNVTIDVRGTVPENGALVVSNHTGPFDILVNASVFPVRFAPKTIPIRLAGVTVSGFPKEEEMCQLEFDFLKDFPFSRKEW